MPVIGLGSAEGIHRRRTQLRKSLIDRCSRTSERAKVHPEPARQPSLPAAGNRLHPTHHRHRQAKTGGDFAFVEEGGGLATCP